MYIVINPATDEIWACKASEREAKQYQHDHDTEGKTVIKTYDEVWPNGILG